jgi:hypothetical protein
MYQQDLPPAPRSGEQAALHDARAIHDLATLRFPSYRGRDAQPQWVLARIDASPQSGSATIPGAVLRDGKLIAPPNTPPVIMKLGAWIRLAGEGGADTAGSAYSWTEPMDEEKRRLSPEDRYSPFASGGLVLFNPEPSRSGAAAFAQAAVVFSDWAGDAPAGARLLRDFAPAIEKAESSQLSRLLAHQNRFLASAAFRRWLQVHGVDRSVIPQAYVQARGNLLSVMTFLLLTETPASQTASELLDAAAHSANPAMLRSIAAGASAVTLFAEDNRPAVALAGTILSAIRERLGEPAIDADPYLRALFPR